MKAIIIGATSGIGKEVAVRLINMGWHVSLTGRRVEALEEIRKEYGSGSVDIARMDVTTEESASVLDSLLEKAGAPDLFMYVSGIGFQNRELDEKKEIYNDGHKAHVAVVSSVAGTAGLGVAPAYSATKSMQQVYVSALTQLAGIEKIPVQFTDIRPGFVKTPILNPEKKYPMTMTLEQAGDHVIRALMKRKRVCIFDWRFRLLVLVWRLIPRPLWERVTWAKN